MTEPQFTKKAQEAISLGQRAMSQLSQRQLDTDHVLYGLFNVEGSIVLQIAHEAGLDSEQCKRQVQEAVYRSQMPSSGAPQSGGQIVITPDLDEAFKASQKEAKRLGDEFVSSEHLLIGIMSIENSRGARIIRQIGLSKEEVYLALQKVRGASRITDEQAEEKYRSLMRFGTDLTEMARAGKLSPVIGREPEIKRVIQILSRKTKNNPVIIGDPGVGKTAIVEGLAQKIVNNEIPETLKGRKLVSLDLGQLVAGAKYRGEFEDRVKAVLKEVKDGQGQIILFIDELHTVVGAGAAEGGMDASNLLKPPLARGDLQCIGATTIDEYRKHIEKDAALERRFAPIMADEPTIEATVEILQGLRPSYERHHSVKITDKALEAAASLSARYITDRFLPDKAIDLVDEAASKVHIDAIYVPPNIQKLENERQVLENEERQAALDGKYEQAAIAKQKRLQVEEKLSKATAEQKMKTGEAELIVDADQIAQIVATWTGIPASNLVRGEVERLERMEDLLHERLINQNEAVRLVSEAIRRSRAGLSDPKRPIGSFIFLGPTGVGKTELAKALAELLFDDEEIMIRIDMSEFMERFDVSKMIGAPPGYVGYDEGGRLTEAVRRRPYSVVLLDEIEKAHPEVQNVLLQVLDDGRLTDGKGRAVNFKNTVIIMTSNIGSELLHNLSRDDGDERTRSEYKATHDAVLARLRESFRPEFLNRVDEIVFFRPLGEKEVRQIVDLLLSGLEPRLKDNELSLEVDDDVKELLAREGFDPQYGARPLKRAIQRLVENPLASHIIRGEFAGKSKVRVQLKNGMIEFTPG
ncbi:AAA family ATPase [bacterium]|nr:AAA family ATPase [bacterium]